MPRQQLGDVRRCRRFEGSPAVLPSGVEVCTTGEENLCGFAMVLLGRDVQRRSRALARGVDVRATGKQDLHDLALAGGSGVVERGTASVCSGADFRAT